MQKKKFNKAPKVSKFDTNELSNMVFDSIFDSPFGGANLHLSDGKALACLMRHDALAS
jgi:hypothetical protein